jgi:hypothetical protein
MIQDYPFPCNDPKFSSVNSFINSDDFPTMWGTFDSMADLILSLPNGCVAATFDISAAYRITPVNPSQLEQNSLCIFWDGMVYVNRALMFGLTSSAGVFGSVETLYFVANWLVIANLGLQPCPSRIICLWEDKIMGSACEVWCCCR